MAGGGTEWQRASGAGNRNADGKQNRLQYDRIGRCQRYPGAHMVPQAHRFNLIQFWPGGNGGEPLVPSRIVYAECVDSRLRDWTAAE